MSSHAAADAEGSEPVGHTPIRALHYKSFLVRIWREREDDPWRASITSVHTKETHAFADVQALFAYLQAQVTVVAGDE